jgi:hypothetical protein
MSDPVQCCMQSARAHARPESRPVSHYATILLHRHLQPTSPSVLLVHVEDAQVLFLRQHALDVVPPARHQWRSINASALTSTARRACDLAAEGARAHHALGREH